jgi:histidine triad (HIT) family protein
MDNCVFCRIVDRKAPARIVYEDDSVVAIEDVNPQAPVHLLVIPREHLPSLMEATPEHSALLGKLLAVAAQLARQRHLEAKGYRTVINTGSAAGQSVLHLHVHVLGGRMFHWPPG